MQPYFPFWAETRKSFFFSRLFQKCQQSLWIGKVFKWKPNGFMVKNIEATLPEPKAFHFVLYITLSVLIRKSYNFLLCSENSWPENWIEYFFPSFCSNVFCIRKCDTNECIDKNKQWTTKQTKYIIYMCTVHHFRDLSLKNNRTHDTRCVVSDE